jgi:hypothetical protein
MILTLTVLTLLVGISGCLYPGPRQWGDWQDRRYDRGGQGNPPARDCFSRDGHWYCRDGN